MTWVATVYPNKERASQVRSVLARLQARYLIASLRGHRRAQRGGPALGPIGMEAGRADPTGLLSLVMAGRCDNIADRTGAAVLAFNVRVLRAAVAGILATVPMSMPATEKAR